MKKTVKKSTKKSKKSLKAIAKKFFNKKSLQTLGICCLMCIWGVCVFLASQYIIGYPLLWIFGSDFISSDLGRCIYSALVYALTLVLIIFVPWKLFKKWKTNREELGLSGYPTWTDIGLAPIGYVVSVLAALLLTAIFSLFPWFDANQAQDTGFSYISSGVDRLVAFLALAVIAPIFEEVVFRGWLYGKLRARLSMPIAIFLVSLTFALLHGQWNVGVNVFALSIVLCVMRELTGTIYSGILLHMLKNGIAFYLLYVIGA